MMRLLAGGFAVLGVASHLLQGNLPHHRVTVSVVELQTAVGFSLTLACFAASGGVLLIGTTVRTMRGRPLADVPTGTRGRGRAPAPPAPPRLHAVPPGEPPPAGGGHVVPLASHPGSDWRQRVMHRASELPLENGVSLSLSLDPSVAPFDLTIGDVPPERARRSAAILASFVAEIPCPPEVRVSFDGFKEVGSARKRLLNSAFSRHFPPSAFTIGPAPDDGLSVQFAASDAGWDEFRPGGS